MKNFPLSAQDHDARKRYLEEIIEKDPTGADEDATGYYVLQLITPGKKSFLEARSLEIVRPLRDDLVIVRASKNQLRAARNLFATASPLNDRWKLSRQTAEMKPSDTGVFVVRVSAWDEVHPALHVFAENDWSRLSDGLLRIYTSLEMIVEHILPLNAVTYAGIEGTQAFPESRVLDLYLAPNKVNRIHNDFPSLNGHTQMLTIKERDLNPDDVDLLGRYVPSGRESGETDNHATDMATIAAGAGNSFVNGKGVAWGAKLTSTDFANIFPDADDHFTGLDTWIQNHAYGTTIENFYGAIAEAYDDQARRLPELLHVFSSGNEGIQPGTGNYNGVNGFANLTGNFKMAKNILTVGCVDTLGRIIPFSSRGPAYDGRVKPELVAYSTQGSSNAAALVSGVVTVLQQAFEEEHGMLPPSALVKAVLINSCMDAGSPGIDFATGYGNVDAFRALTNILAEQYFSGSVSQGGTVDFSIDIPAPARNLKVTLVWSDPAAGPDAATALVNDLDLRVANGETWLPWVLNPSPDVSSLNQPAQRAPDHLNNVELVTVEAVLPGMYNISIEGFDIPEGTQEFFVAYQWDEPEQFSFSFPTAADNFPFDGETGTYFFWNSTLAENNGALEFSTDGGSSWQTVAVIDDLAKGSYRWSNVPQITSEAIARVVTASDVFYTEPFTISRPLEVSTGFNCADSVLIRWPYTEGADHYRVFGLGDGPLLDHLFTTTDTSRVVTKGDLPSEWFAVEPVLPGGKPGIRSQLASYNLLGAECYLLAFTNEVVPEAGIKLKITLGTIYGIDHIDVEHEQDGAFEVIGSIDPVSNFTQFLHGTPHQGLNSYRLTIRFVNGETLVSETISNYYLTTLPFLVFPNPAAAAGELSVYSKVFETPDVMFRLFKTDGSLVLEYPLISDRDFVPLNNVAPGYYLYRISSPDGTFRGKLVVK